MEKEFIKCILRAVILLCTLIIVSSGNPAARVGDTQLCPAATPFPHGGGPILPPGCPSVLIGGKPAARLGDEVHCVASFPIVYGGHIVTGSSSVFIGGKPAARLGDFTDHGGMIITGCESVLIGN